jgi:uncharacterized RDD family membrane protein YckC
MKRRIGFGPRLLAFLTDSFIIGFTASLVMAVVMKSTFQSFLSGQYVEALTALSQGQDAAVQGGALDSLLRVTSFITSWSLLYMLIEGFTGASPGKMLLGLKIGTEDGQIADSRTYFYRYLLKNGASLLGVFGKTSGLLILNNIGNMMGMVIFFGCFMTILPHRQAIHDMVVKTAVFRKNDLESNDKGG